VSQKAGQYFADFQNYFIISLSGKHNNEYSLLIPPHLKPMATLPYAKQIPEN